MPSFYGACQTLVRATALGMTRCILAPYQCSGENGRRSLENVAGSASPLETITLLCMQGRVRERVGEIWSERDKVRARESLREGERRERQWQTNRERERGMCMFMRRPYNLFVYIQMCVCVRVYINT